MANGHVISITCFAGCPVHTATWCQFDKLKAANYVLDKVSLHYLSLFVLLVIKLLFLTYGDST